jgi:hypothetical protein
MRTLKLLTTNCDDKITYVKLNKHKNTVVKKEKCITRLKWLKHNKNCAHVNQANSCKALMTNLVPVQITQHCGIDDLIAHTSFRNKLFKTKQI